MGVKSSKVLKHSQRNQLRIEEMEIQLISQKIENFVLLAYLSGSKVDGVKLTLWSSSAYNHFCNYLVTQEHTNAMHIWSDIMHIVSLPINQMVECANKLRIEHLSANRDHYASASLNIVEKLAKEVARNPPHKPSLTGVLLAIADELLLGVAGGLWFKYVPSKNFQIWYVLI